MPCDSGIKTYYLSAAMYQVIVNDLKIEYVSLSFVHGHENLTLLLNTSLGETDVLG